MLPRTPVTDVIGSLFARIVVPLWILAGVTFKLHSGDPRTLPNTFVTLARDLDLNLGAVLYTLIGLEILAIAVMVFLARLAWPMAIFMLSAFCLILLNEMRVGEESCGCFGGQVTLEPWKMLIADGTLLAIVLAFRPRPSENSLSLAAAIPSAVGFGVLGLAISFTVGSVLHPGTQQQGPRTDENEPLDPTVNPEPMALPPNWYPQDVESWEGTPWRELEIFRMMPEWPSDMDEGKRYVVFYSRTCDHCEEMFHFDLTQPLDAPVTAVEIPDSRDQLTSPHAWPMPEEVDHIELLELPLGPTWIITAPLALRIEDGIVTCAEEGDHLGCLELQ